MTSINRVSEQTAWQASGAFQGATVSLTHQLIAPARISDIVELTTQAISKIGQWFFMTGTALVEGVPVISAQGELHMSFNRS